MFFEAFHKMFSDENGSGSLHEDFLVRFRAGPTLIVIIIIVTNLFTVGKKRSLK